MDEELFWQMISAARKRSGYPDSLFHKELELLLLELPLNYVRDFFNIADSKVNLGVWESVRNYNNLISLSDQEFISFKYWTVSRGRTYFESIISCSVTAGDAVFFSDFRRMSDEFLISSREAMKTSASNLLALITCLRAVVLVSGYKEFQPSDYLAVSRALHFLLSSEGLAEDDLKGCLKFSSSMLVILGGDIETEDDFNFSLSNVLADLVFLTNNILDELADDSFKAMCALPVYNSCRYIADKDLCDYYSTDFFEAIAENFRRASYALDNKDKILSHIDEDEFWNIIEDSRFRFSDGKRYINCDEQTYGILVDRLYLCSCEAISEFDNIFSVLMKKADAPSLREISPCPGSGFSDFTGWIISMGREFYLKALNAPFSLEERGFFHSFDYAAHEAYNKKTGV